MTAPSNRLTPPQSFATGVSALAAYNSCPRGLPSEMKAVAACVVGGAALLSTAPDQKLLRFAVASLTGWSVTSALPEGLPNSVKSVAGTVAAVATFAGLTPDSQRMLPRGWTTRLLNPPAGPQTVAAARGEASTAREPVG